MAPKKKAAAKKAASGPPAASESKDVRWIRKQQAALAAQRKAAAARGDTWLEAPHSWHHEQLEQLVSLLESRGLAELPTEVQEGVEFYISQFADGEVTSQEAFYVDHEVYGGLLKSTEDAAKADAPYERPEETAEALAAIETISSWSDTSMYGMSKFVNLLKAHPESAGVQEAGLKRLSALLADAKGAALTATTQGLAPAQVVPLIGTAMRRVPRDTQLQIAGCGTMRQAVAVEGAIFEVLQAKGADIVVEAMRGHITDKPLLLYASRALGDIMRRSPKNSAEWARLRSSGAEDVLHEVVSRHGEDALLDKEARTIIPFLRD